MATEPQQKLSLRRQLQVSKPEQIASLPEVGDRFVQLYKMFNARDGKGVYEAEKFHFAKIISSSDKLKQCTQLSLYGCFLDMAVNGLSFDPSMKHAYLVPFSVNVGSRDNKVWEQRAQLQISGIGELALRVQQGQIKYADNPVLVYEGDLFKMGTVNNGLYITHEVILPRAEGAKIIACYLRITRNDDTIDYKVLTAPEFEQLRAFSKDQNSMAWTTGRSGMFQSKTIKHAFRTYPKLKTLAIAAHTALESEMIDREVPDANDIYALDEEPAGQTTIIAQQKTEQVKQPLSQNFKQPIVETAIAFDEDFNASPLTNGTQKNTLVEHDDENF